MDEQTERVEFNIDSVTVEEAILLEETLGIPWLNCISSEAASAKVMRGFVWLYQRRTDPTLQLADVHFNIQRFGQELGAPEEGEEEPVPLPEASEPSGTSSTSSSTRSTDSNPGTSNGSPSSNSSDAAPALHP